jgi:pimeloyl-ACP methyl ester carboxylesterase
MERIIYLISGMGADERAFRNLDLGNERVRYIRWIKSRDKEKLRDYSARLIEQIDTTKPVILIGTSLGGMMCIEIAKKIKVEKTFIIASVKTKYEMPLYYWIFRLFPFYLLIPGRIFISFRNFIARILFGTKASKNGIELFTDMLKKQDPDFMKWSMTAALWWDNAITPENVIHYHGTNDFVFPIKRIKNCITLENATHVMVLTRARELSKLIKDELADVMISE